MESSDHGLDAVYHDHYSVLPSAPPIHVPIPPYGSNFLQRLREERPIFLPSEAPFEGDTVKSPTMVQWSYDDRYKAQRVLSYLWIGPSAVTKSPQFFAEAGITFVLGVSLTAYKFVVSTALKRIMEMGIETAYLEIKDTADHLPVFTRSYELIRDHYLQQLQLGRQCKVLVFCDSGNGKSVSVVSAYLMQAYLDVDHLKAVQVTQSVRFSAGWQGDQKQILANFWDILCARRAVAGYQTTTPTTIPKRSLDWGPDADMDEEEQTLAERRSYAPFRDFPYYEDIVCSDKD